MNAIEKKLIFYSSDKKLKLYEKLVELGCDVYHHADYINQLTTVSLYINRIHIDSIYLFHNNQVKWFWKQGR
jgi:hypothetical protein